MEDPLVPKKTTAVFIYHLSPPASKTVRFESTISSPPNSALFNSLSTLTRTREDLLSTLSRRTSSVDQINQSCDRYLPLLAGLHQYLSTCPTVTLKTPLAFTWSSALLSASSSRWSTFYTSEFESAMALHAKAATLVNHAELASLSFTPANFGDLAPAALKSLRAAAGLFEFVASAVLPSWSNAPEDRPPELYSNCCQAMSQMCLAWAQELMVVQGSLKGTSAPVLAKLEADAHNRYADASSALQNARGVCIELKSYASAMVLLSKAQTFKYSAIAAHEAERTGQGVAFANGALQAFWDAKKQLMTFLQGQRGWGGQWEALREELEHYQRLYGKENSMVDFQKVADARLLEMPPPKALVSPLPYSVSAVPLPV